MKAIRFFAVFIIGLLLIAILSRSLWYVAPIKFPLEFVIDAVKFDILCIIVGFYVLFWGIVAIIYLARHKIYNKLSAQKIPCHSRQGTQFSRRRTRPPLHVLHREDEPHKH